jgi:thioredoxin-related protein
MRTILLAIVILLNNAAFAQEENGLVNWIDFKTAQAKYKENPKPIIIDFYTDWCGWCKHMMKTTYSNPSLAGYINQHFYAVKFNAETKDTIEYQGKVYKPLSPAPRTPHELTVKFLGEKMSYPSTVFVTNTFSYNLLVQGYLEDKKIEPMLVFFVENTWQTSTFDEFNKHFTHAFYDTAYKKQPVKVYTIGEVEKLQKKNRKKVLVSLGAPFCNTGIVMNKTTFTDTSIAKYLSEKYYLVNLDVTQKDTIKFKNEKFFPVPVNGFPMHSLAFKLTNNRFSLPAICVLDEDLNTLDVLNFYQSPEHLKPILHYFGGDVFRKKSYADFLQESAKESGKTSH